MAKKRWIVGMAGKDPETWFVLVDTTSRGKEAFHEAVYKAEDMVRERKPGFEQMAASGWELKELMKGEECILDPEEE